MSFTDRPFLKSEYSQIVEQQVRQFDTKDEAHTFLNHQSDISFRTPHFFFVDSTFFDMFNVELVQGNSENVLDTLLSLVLSEEVAERIYPGEDPIGKTLRYKGISTMEMTINEVMNNWPDESHMSPIMLASFTNLNILYRQNPEYYDNWW